MGRLFWKFFFFIWLAQLTAISGITATFWLEHGTPDKKHTDLDKGYAATLLVRSAAIALQDGGIQSLRNMLENQNPHLVYAVDEQNVDILGRKIDPAILNQARQCLDNDGPSISSVMQISIAGGHSFLLFLPMLESSVEANGFAGGRLALPNGFHIPIEPMVAAMLASLVFAALLARYFSKPIRNLRSAFEAATTGNLEVRIGPVMGKRRDELADLGRNFDLMADHLRSLMGGQRRLLHDVSHELRSPLARLQAAIGLIRQQPEKQETYLQRIEQESVRMDKLVGELLTISRLEAGVISSMNEVISMDELISDVVVDACFEAGESGHTVEFSDNSKSIIKGNAELLHRAIENVVRNAIRHTPAGSKVSVGIRSINNSSNVLISITDQGPGIPEKELSGIFEPFFRGSGMKSTDGHGLGLAIARRVVEAHGGTISASNRAGGGLCVEIVLPVKLF